MKSTDYTIAGKDHLKMSKIAKFDGNCFKMRKIYVAQ
jgi:hypothetical protein